MRVRDLLRSIDFDKIPDMALRDCHARGVDSIVLSIHPDGKPSRRIFVAHEGSDLRRLYRDDGHYVVGVHNHRFDIRLRCAAGVLINHRVALWPEGRGSEAEALWEHRFSSGIGGEARLGDPAQRRVLNRWDEVLRPGDSVFMRAELLHTVVVPVRAAWVVEEGPDRMDSFLYSPLLYPDLRTEGMYTPMSRDEARQVVEEALGWV